MIEKLMNQSLEDKIDSDLAKEVLMVISYWDSKMINQIPKNLYKRLTELASLSTNDFYINKNQSLINQELSEDCKDIISIIYFLYIAEENEKQELLDKWIYNIKQKDD